MFKPLHQRGLFLMKLSPETMEDQLPQAYENVLEQEEIPQPAEVDMDLVLKVCDMVPRHTWPAVLEAAVANIVDELPVETMFKMCELYLIDYYLQNPMEIIPDMFRIKGEESTLYILDSLQLDKIPVPKEKRETEEQGQDNSPCSIDPD
jgi:hypothetical protein